MNAPRPASTRDGGQSLIRATSVLASGSAVGQLAAFLLSPVLALLFDPAAFGVLATFVAVVSVITVVAGLRYELAIPLPADEGDAAALVMAALALCTLSALLSWPVLHVLDRIGLSLLPPTAGAAAAVAVLASGGYEILNRWAMRRERISLAAASKVVQGLTVPVLQIGLGWLALLPPASALIAGYVAGRAAALGLLLYGLCRRGGGRLLRAGLNGRRMRAALIRYRRFPLYTSAAAVMNSLGSRLLVLYLAAYADAATTGACAFAYIVLAAPVGLIGQATAQLIHARGAKVQPTGGLSALVWSVFTTLVRTGLPLGVVIAVSAPEVFAVLFGAQWRAAGTIAQWLVPWLLVTYIASPLSVIPSVLERQSFDFVMQTTLVAARILALAVGWLLDNHEVAIWLFSAASAVVTAAFVLPTLRLAAIPCRRALKTVAANAVLAAGLAAAVLAGKLLAPEALRNPLTVATAVSACVLVGCILVFRQRALRSPLA